MNEERVERDSMGDMRVPANALYGASTARAVHNFPISGRGMPQPFIVALCQIKRAAAETNSELGMLDATVAQAIVAAADRVCSGEFAAHFVVDVFQTGSGTSTNMNANEVIAHVAQQASGLKVHPNDHVNMSQSSNDVIPTATHVAIKSELERVLVPALDSLRAALARKAEAFADVLKSGRTHLQDAVPISLGQEFAGYAWQTSAAARRATWAADELGAVALGGTAVGTGVNAHPSFAAQAISRLAKLSGLKLFETGNHVAAQASPDSLVAASACLRGVALALMKIANDIRWLASGPAAGIGEIRLPAVQPGSSIMPGKINPVIAESLLMVCAEVIGNDAAVAVAAHSSQFELHTMWPLCADKVLESIRLLANAVHNFADKLVDGIEAQPERCEELLLKNASVATVVAPALGYDRVAKWVHDANENGEQILHKVPGRNDVYRIGDQIIARERLIGPYAPDHS